MQMSLLIDIICRVFEVDVGYTIWPYPNKCEVVMFRMVMLISCLIVLFSCSDNSTSTENKKTVIDHQIKALEKAKGVEAQIFDSAQQQREIIDNQ